MQSEVRLVVPASVTAHKDFWSSALAYQLVSACVYRNATGGAVVTRENIIVITITTATTTTTTTIIICNNFHSQAFFCVQVSALVKQSVEKIDGLYFY